MFTSTSPDRDHDHGRCIAAALARAEALCERQGRRLTPLRRRVLEMVWAGHKPVSAYDILHALHAEGHGSSPPVAYRALAFLVEAGLVHRLEHRNAYVGCALGGPVADGAQMYVCTVCGEVTELADPAVGDGLRAAAARIGFTIQRRIIEVQGVCRACRDKGARH